MLARPELRTPKLREIGRRSSACPSGHRWQLSGSPACTAAVCPSLSLYAAVQHHRCHSGPSAAVSPRPARRQIPPPALPISAGAATAPACALLSRRPVISDPSLRHAFASLPFALPRFPSVPPGRRTTPLRLFLSDFDRAPASRSALLRACCLAATRLPSPSHARKQDIAADPSPGSLFVPRPCLAA